MNRLARGRPSLSTRSGTLRPTRAIRCTTSPYAAAFVAKTVMEASGLVEGYSFWTFSDIFEENYFPSVPFHGGFGLLNLHGIAKPTYRAFELLHRLGTNAVAGRRPASRRSTPGSFAGRQADITSLLTNHALPRHPIAAAARAGPACRMRPNRRVACLERIDEDHANAKRSWRDVGRAEISRASRQSEQLHAASRTVTGAAVHGRGTTEQLVHLDIELPPHAVAAIHGGVHASTSTTEAHGHESGARMTCDEELGHASAEYVPTTSGRGNQPCQRVGARQHAQTAMPASIAAVGLGLWRLIPSASSERSSTAHTGAGSVTLATLRFFWNSSARNRRRTRPATKASITTSSTSRPADARGSSELSTIDTTHPDRRRVDRCGLFRSDRPRMSARFEAGRRAVPARRLAMGAKRRRDRHARLDAGERLPALSTGRDITRR